MKKVFKFLFLIILILALLLVGCMLYGYQYYKDLTGKESVADKVSDIKSEFTFVSLKDVPECYKEAIVAVEDRRFYSHGAVDPVGLIRATFNNLKTQEMQQGGSTITQQVAKNMYLIGDDSDPIKRKFAEFFLANELEKYYEKDEILELYMNIIYFGNGYYGIKEACNGYLKKQPKDMNISEATMMAGIPNAPSVYSPLADKNLCKSRQKKVIETMVSAGYITEIDAEAIDSDFIDKIE